MLCSLQYSNICINNSLRSFESANVIPEKWNTSTSSKALAMSISPIFILQKAELSLSYITLDDLIPLPT